MPGIDRSSRIALLVGIVPVRLVTKKFKVYLTCLQLCLLQAEEISVQFRKDVSESLSAHGPQAVHIP